MSPRSGSGKGPRSGGGAQEMRKAMPSEFLRIPGRRIVVESPVVQIPLSPGDRVLVQPGETVAVGTPLAESTLDASLVEAGRLVRSNGNGAGGLSGPHGPAGRDRRTDPQPGKWWSGGDERRGKGSRREKPRRLGGTLLYELEGRWIAAAGERHETIDSPVSGVVVQARSDIGLSVKIDGVAIPAAIAAGRPTRGHLEVPRLIEGELRDAPLDMGRSGAIVLAGSRLSTESITKARAMSVSGIVAGSIGQTEVRDLAASELRQRAALHNLSPFAVIGFDGHQRRPIASPILALLSALSGRQVSLMVSPPLVILGLRSVTLPDLPPDAIRVRAGQHAGREGRWVSSAGLYRFRAGVYLEAANVRLDDDTELTIVPLADLERFVL